MSTTLIQVKATDNELMLIASTPAGSQELFHIKSGYNNPVAYQVVPQSIMAPGNYSLTMIGVNWGGPANFTVIVTTNGTPTTYTAPASSAVGVTWALTIPMTV